jgi:hypothetical protein
MNISVKFKCAYCEKPIDTDTDFLMIVNSPRKDVGMIAYCEAVACTERGAELVTTSARRFAAGIKRDEMPQPPKPAEREERDL